MSNASFDRDDLLTAKEVAELFRVSTATVNRWARRGKFSSLKTLGGHRRFDTAEIYTLLGNRTRTIDDDRPQADPLQNPFVHQLPAPLPTQADTPIPRSLQGLLLAAQTAERAAQGPQRRIAYRLTREVIGGVIDAGYSTTHVAEVLGVTVPSVRGRAGRGRWTALAAITALLDIPPGTVRKWGKRGLLPHRQDGPGRSVLVPTVDAIRILASHYPPAPPGRTTR